MSLIHAADDARRSPLSGQNIALGLGLALIAALAVMVWSTGVSAGVNAPRLTALVLVGAALGLVLHRADFGFAGGFRAVVERRDMSAFRAHVLMLAILSAIALPLLAMGEIFGQRLVGVVTPVGVSFVFGALLFGVGMQVGGGCASGTLYGLGGGDARLGLTFIGFVSGSTLAASQMEFWWSLPKLEAVTLLQSTTLPYTLAIQAVSLLAFFGLLKFFGCRRSEEHAEEPTRVWPLWVGGVLLALLNGAVLVLSGQPWGEAPAFALWGSKIVAAFGVDVLWWEYWARPGFDRQIEQSIFLDSVSILNIAIMVGALIAAASAGQFRLVAPRDWRVWAAALVGGLMMGFGARLTNGCNIGAYVSGVGTGALSGWVWLALALIGSYVGARLRPALGLKVAIRTDGGGC
ncbi:MAG: YeeE/YedE family protein [Bosea sp. (in: a-proteobacteria)]